jgi:hypothetical protein
MKVKVNDTEINFHIEGERFTGENKVLLHQHDDITAHTPWAAQGYVVTSFLPAAHYQQFQAGMETHLRKILKTCDLTDDEGFPLEKYHHLIRQYEQHLWVVDHAKLIQGADFPIAVKMMEERVSEICQAEVHNLNPYTKERVFHFRIIRPQSNDNNPLHRDVWLEEYHDGINIYVPICGSNEHSSLTLVPGSHYWTEDEIARTAKGARVNGIQYNVPALLDAKREMEVIRPHPKANEILVFSPYLLHGGAVNLNQDTTRISVEMRFWRKLN